MISARIDSRIQALGIIKHHQSFRDREQEDWWQGQRAIID